MLTRSIYTGRSKIMLKRSTNTGCFKIMLTMSIYIYIYRTLENYA